MPRYLRPKTEGSIFFFTVVAFGRRKILTIENSRKILSNAVAEVRTQYPFSINAWVLLPEHLHAIWTLPEGDTDYSKRWGLIKAKFSKESKLLFHEEHSLTPSRNKRRETTIWQRRFWEHSIRDDEDFRNHIDYIHYNPVKHGLVQRVGDWPYSTFHSYVREGLYPENWGEGVSFSRDDSFGE
ncbi:MAG: transposase [Syntrophobacterales bacterium]|jgi:putative transposase|nr:transposase [Syntrophobacterales bacterium]